MNILKEFKFEGYSKQDEVKKLNELKQKLYNEEYKIGIVANMSAGKSTFYQCFIWYRYITYI